MLDFTKMTEPKKRNPEKTKKRIYKVAKQEFAKHGFHGTSAEKIASKAKVSKAMMFYYFKSKQNLYMEILNEFIFLEKIAPLFNEIENNKNLSPYEKIYIMNHVFIDSYMEKHDKYMNLIYFHAIIELPKMVKNGAIFKSLLEGMESMARVIDKGAETGHFKFANGKFAAFQQVVFLSNVNMKKALYEGTSIGDILYNAKDKQAVYEKGNINFIRSLAFNAELEIELSKEALEIIANN